MNDMAAKVDGRLAALFDRGDTTTRDAGMTTAGTDVDGPMLTSELAAASFEAKQQFRTWLLSRDDDEQISDHDLAEFLGAAVGGFSLQFFWLGFEYGKAEQ